MKTRITVPTDLAAKVLFLSDRCCCVCQKRNNVQIHHVDEDPSNNDADNLAVLCFDCHTDTQIKGGFHRKLDSAQIRLYRENWYQQVAKKRNPDLEVSLEKFEKLAILLTDKKEALLKKEKEHEISNRGKIILNILSTWSEDSSRALSMVEEELKNNSKDIDFLHLKFGMLLEKEKFSEALDCIDILLSIEETATFLGDKSVVLYNLGKKTEAEELMNKALQIDPDEIGANFLKALISSDNNEYEKAIFHYDVILKNHPHNTPSINNKGLICLRQGKNEEAHILFELILNLEPDDVYALSNNGFALNKLGKYNEAVSCYDKILKLNPHDIDALTDQGHSLTSLGEYKEALDRLDTALTINPTSIEALLEKATALGQLSKSEEEIDCYKKILEIEPKNTIALAGIAVTYFLTNRDAEALSYFDQAIESNPLDHELQVRKGHTLINLGMTERAIEIFQKIVKDDPTDDHALLHLGQVLCKIGNLDAGIDTFNKISKRAMHYSLALYGRAIAECLKGDVDDSLISLAQAITLDDKIKNLAVEEQSLERLRSEPRFLKLLS